MPNWQEVNHVKKHVVGEVLYVDIHIYQDVGNHELPNAFEISVGVRLAGAVITQSQRAPLKDGPLAVKFLSTLQLSDLRGEIDDWRGVLRDGAKVSHDPHWADAAMVVFKISAIGNALVPLKILPIRANVDLGHADIATIIHRVAGKPVGVQGLS